MKVYKFKTDDKQVSKVLFDFELVRVDDFYSHEIQKEKFFTYNKVLDVAIKEAIREKIEEIGGLCNDKTVEYFINFFTEDELIGIFNSEIFKYLYETEEDFKQQVNDLIEEETN